MNISLTDELKDFVQKKVASGAFPSEEAVINAALKQFLLSAELAAPPIGATGLCDERLPGPFLEDEAIPAPMDLPRPGQVVARTYLRDKSRSPDLFPGE